MEQWSNSDMHEKARGLGVDWNTLLAPRSLWVFNCVFDDGFYIPDWQAVTILEVYAALSRFNSRVLCFETFNVAIATGV